jgi:hypothetical protein
MIKSEKKEFFWGQWNKWPDPAWFNRSPGDHSFKVAINRYLMVGILHSSPQGLTLVTKVIYPLKESDPEENNSSNKLQPSKF